MAIFFFKKLIKYENTEDYICCYIIGGLHPQRPYEWYIDINEEPINRIGFQNYSEYQRMLKLEKLSFSLAKNP